MLEFLPAIAAVGNDVHIVWQDDTSAQSNLFDILYRRSLDAGNSFTDIENLSDPNTAPSTLPAIAAIANNVHVVWVDSAGASDIFYIRLSHSFSPSIALLGSNVYLVWSDNTNGNFDIPVIPLVIPTGILTLREMFIFITVDTTTLDL